jgi:hypothetical protein
MELLLSLIPLIPLEGVAVMIGAALVAAFGVRWIKTLGPLRRWRRKQGQIKDASGAVLYQRGAARVTLADYRAAKAQGGLRWIDGWRWQAALTLAAPLIALLVAVPITATSYLGGSPLWPWLWAWALMGGVEASFLVKGIKGALALAGSVIGRAPAFDPGVIGPAMDPWDGMNEAGGGDARN